MENASAITVLTGAGISAESGIPTFRGATGLWKEFRPEDLAAPEAFARDPETVWKWYDWRRRLIQQAQPNPGHIALAELERRARSFTLITQNVDGLHQRAGSRNVLELHGSIWLLRCTKCHREWQDMTVPLGLPHCECGALARPGVVWFGELLPCGIWSSAEHATTAATYSLSPEHPPRFILLPVSLTARASCAQIIEVNTERTAASASVDCTLIGPAGEILPKLI